jgi:hypothetical protein
VSCAYSLSLASVTRWASSSLGGHSPSSLCTSHVGECLPLTSLPLVQLVGRVSHRERHMRHTPSLLGESLTVVVNTAAHIHAKDRVVVDWELVGDVKPSDLSVAAQGHGCQSKTAA